MSETVCVCVERERERRLSPSEEDHRLVRRHDENVNQRFLIVPNEGRFCHDDVKRRLKKEASLLKNVSNADGDDDVGGNSHRKSERVILFQALNSFGCCETFSQELSPRLCLSNAVIRSD